MENNSFNICIDIGNTRFKIALFQGDELVEQVNCYKEDLDDKLDQLGKNRKIDAMIVSSTRKGIAKEVKKYGKKLDTYIELDHLTPLPIKIEYDTPETLGRDRIASAVGANSLYPDEGNIVIDAGTCVTYDYIDAKACFKGGNISPGIRMRINAMHDHTANLPLVDVEIPASPVGKSTEEALQNGAIRGTIYELESFIRLIETKYGATKTLLTGGDSIYFVDNFKSKIFVVQNLVLFGLNKILQHNAQ